jgi:hypothetical protein
MGNNENQHLHWATIYILFFRKSRKYIEENEFRKKKHVICALFSLNTPQIFKKETKNAAQGSLISSHYFSISINSVWLTN